MDLVTDFTTSGSLSGPRTTRPITKTKPWVSKTKPWVDFYVLSLTGFAVCVGDRHGHGGVGATVGRVHGAGGRVAGELSERR